MIASVIVDISSSEIDNVFDYNIPSGMSAGAGDRVLVPFGARRIEGFIISVSDTYVGEFKLKDIIARLDDFTAINGEMLALMRYMKESFNVRSVDALRLFVPAKLRGGRIKEATKSYLSLKESLTAEEIAQAVPKRAKSQLAIVDRLSHGDEDYTVMSAEFSAGAIKSLVEKGLVEKITQVRYRRPYEAVHGSAPSVVLTDDQKRAEKSIFAAPQDAVLLHGVTGSGKTEVYMSCIERALSEGRNAIMLVPEISLTPQTLRVFRGRFGDSVAMLHSGLSDGERYDEWRRLLKGEARIVVGARSAIFAPLENVGVIIIDEEHDQSYVSDSNPRYDTQEIARFRAKYNGGKLIVGSATPSVETYLKAKRGEYALVTLDKRVNAKEMPRIEIVDMSRELIEGNDGIFSRELKQALTDTVKAGNQAIIFVNRRGYASFVMCKKCGYTAKCDNCDVSLTYHSEDGELKCHYCGKRYRMLTECPACGAKEIRQGKVGTERVVKEIRELLPDVGILRMDNDTTSTKSAYLDILGAFREKEAQVLVGTQMIAKGHDFPDVTLVGILDADMSLYFADYRSTERTYQLVTQVAGRAGRSEKTGRVLLQTFSPRHYVFRFAENYNYAGFFEKERNTREVTKFPPYSTVIRVLMTSLSDDDARRVAKNVYTEMKFLRDGYMKDFIYMQAMRSPVKRIQNKFRYQVLMRVYPEREREILAHIYDIIDRNRDKNVWTFAEINPQNMS